MSDCQVLKKLNCPAFCVKCLDNGLIAVSGGGGTAKTGVDNCIELGIIDYDYTSNDFNIRFNTIYDQPTSDACMKFMSFQIDVDIENLERDKNKQKQASPAAATKTKPSMHTYLVAALGSAVELYKLIPTIEKRTALSPSPSHEDLANAQSNGPNNSNQNNNNVRKRNKHGGGGHQHHGHNQQQDKNNQQKPPQSPKPKNGCVLKASARLKLVKTFTIDDETQTETASTVRGGSTSSEPEHKIQQISPNEINALAVSICTSSTDNENEKKEKHSNKKHQKSHQQSSHHKKDVLIIAGTTGGSIVIWNLFEFVKKHEIKNAHLKEIDDLQVNMCSNNQEHFLTASKDGKSYIWSVQTYEKIKELKSDSLAQKNLRMRHARFTTQQHLYTTYIPVIRGKHPKSYIVKWKSLDYKIESTHTANTVITAFQANYDGKYICYGDFEGQIILLNENFHQLNRFKKYHSNVVTDLAFFHDSQKSYDENKLILSLSIDRTIQCYKYLSVKSFDSFKYFAIFLILVILFCYFFTYLE